MRSHSTCSAAGCDLASRSKGFCQSHYQKVLRRGTTEPGHKGRKAKTMAESFARFSNQQESGCWEWTGPRDPHNYGVICFERKRTFAHRVSWALAHGGGVLPPSSTFICHTCDNPPCVNPDHLFAGSNQDNCIDMAKKNRGANAYSLELVRAIREFRPVERGDVTAYIAAIGVSKTNFYQIRRGAARKYV